MSLTATRYEYISLDEAGVPRITGTTTKVVELVLSYLSSGSSPEELHLNYPYLSLGQIHSALAYYWDHKADLDRDIEGRLQRVNELRRTLPTSPLVTRLREQLHRYSVLRKGCHKRKVGHGTVFTGFKRAHR
jgi:uncharacterized protein (DUF433 family)